MKTIRASILAAVGLCLAACGGVDDDDIQAALKKAAPATSTLNYKIGENWKAKKVVVTKGNVGSLPGASDLKYKFEKGQATPCDDVAAAASLTDCGVVQSVILTDTTSYDSSVTAKTDPAVTKTPGFVVSESASTITDEQYLYPVSGTQGTSNLPVDSLSNSVYTLAELNNFVVRIGSQTDSDVGASTTLFPSHPEKGRTYTDDLGMSFAFTTATSVKLASRSVSALVGNVATSQTSGITLQGIQQKCFRRDPFGGTSTTNSDINVYNDCTGWLQLASERSVTVGLDLNLHETVKTVRINLTGWGVRDNTGVLISTNVPNSLGGEIVFTYDAQESTTTYDVSDVTFK